MIDLQPSSLHSPLTNNMVGTDDVDDKREGVLKKNEGNDLDEGYLKSEVESVFKDFFRRDWSL